MATKSTQGGPTYQQPSPAQRELGLWVSGAGNGTKNSPSDGVDGRELDCYAVVLVEHGRGVFDSKPTGTHAVKQGALLWLFPGVAHSYRAAPRWRETWLMFDGSLLDKLRAQGFMDPTQAVQRAGSDGAVRACLGRAYEAYTAGGPMSVPLASAALLELIVRAHAVEHGLLNPARNIRDRTVRLALQHIEEHATESIRPARLALELGVPYASLRRRFRQQTGFSLQEYAIAVRIRLAKNLLVSGELSVQEVAAECGFSDPYYFTRLFTRRVGMNPSSFRRQGQL